MEDTPAPTLVGCQALEQFLLLAKTAKGSAVAELVRHATEAGGVFVFGELLECECVQETRDGPHASSVKLLEIFAYGTYEDYKSKSVVTLGTPLWTFMYVLPRRSRLPSSPLSPPTHQVEAPQHRVSCLTVSGE